MADMITPFDLIDKDLNGVVVRARPVGWSGSAVDGEGHLADGSHMVPTDLETMCPFCGQLVKFPANLKSVKCTTCGKGSDIKMIEDFLNPFCEPGEFDTLLF